MCAGFTLQSPEVCIAHLWFSEVSSVFSRVLNDYLIQLSLDLVDVSQSFRLPIPKMATTVSKLPEGQKSYCGIPEATFIEDVDTYMTKYIKGGNKIEDKMQVQILNSCNFCLLTLSSSFTSKYFSSQDMQQIYGKYKLMEANLLQKKRKLKNQIPEIKTSLEMVKVLKRKRDAKEKMDTHFLLSDLVYSKATVPPTDKVILVLFFVIAPCFNLYLLRFASGLELT